MTEEIKEDMKKLKEEIANLRNQLKDLAENQGGNRGLYIDIGNPMRHYIDHVMQGVAENVQGELERSVFIGPRGLRILRSENRAREETEANVDFSKVAQAMSALGHEHRLKILNELVSGGKYINELQEKLPEITTSTLSSHLNVLEETGFVVQEKVRGRYLITMPGRTAYQMAKQATKFLEQRNGE